MPQIIERTFNSNIDMMTDIVRDIISCIDSKIKEDKLFEIRLILSELIVNSIRHGNKYDVEKKVNVHLKIEEDKIRIRVTDEGEGLSNDSCSVRDEFSESGRGLSLVESLSDSFYINENNFICIKFI